MPSPNATFTEMVTTTLRNHKKQLTDNVSANNALLRVMKEKGKIQTRSGGYEIVLPLDYAENATYQRYAGYDPLNISACLLYTSPSPRDGLLSRMPSSA